MKQFLFSVFLSIFIFDGVIEISRAEIITIQRVLEEFANKVKPIFDASIAAAEDEFDRVKNIRPKPAAYYEAERAYEKVKNDSRRYRVNELARLFESFPVTNKVIATFAPIIIPDQVKTHIENLENITSRTKLLALVNLLNKILSTQEELNLICIQILENLQSDLGVASRIPSDIVYNSWHTRILDNELFEIIKFNIPNMKRKNTFWRNKFQNQVNLVSQARVAFTNETESIMQKLNDPNTMNAILKNYKSTQNNYKRAIEKTKEIVNDYFVRRNAFVDILMGDRTNFYLFTSNEKDKVTLQLF